MQQGSDVILDKAVAIIADNLGSNTAVTYRNFFSGDSAEEVLMSIQTLMSRLVGNQNAKQQLEALVAEYKL